MTETVPTHDHGSDVAVTSQPKIAVAVVGTVSVEATSLSLLVLSSPFIRAL